MGFTDIHCHLLWGLDDGARSSDETHAMLRAAAADGITRIVATPHATPGVYPFDRGRLDRALDGARECCAREGLGIEILEGAEILYTEQTCRFLEDGRVPALAGTRCALVEFSPDARWELLRGALERLRRSGFTPVLAHAERYGCLAGRPARLEELRGELEVRFQLNCASILRPPSLSAARLIRRVLSRNLLDFAATDAHRPEGPRSGSMRAAYEALRARIGEERARAAVDGSRLPGAEDSRGGAR